MTAVQEQGFQEVAQLCDEVEVGDRDAELQFLHQLRSVHTLQHVVHSRSSISGKQLLQQACLCSVAPAVRRGQLTLPVAVISQHVAMKCDLVLQTYSKAAYVHSRHFVVLPGQMEHNMTH